MTKIFFEDILDSKGLDSILEKEQFVAVKNLAEAEIAVYGGSLETFMGKLASLDAQEIKLKTLLPFKTFVLNAHGRPATFSESELVRRDSFEREDIRQVSEKIEKVIALDNGESSFGDLARYMKANAIELVQNALIHKRTSQSLGVIDLSLYETSGFYGISVTDPFGALSADKALKKLVRVYRDRSYETKDTGAGLGLYMVLNASDSVVIEIKRNRSSRVCCIMNKYKRLKEFKAKSPALYLIEE